MTQEGKRRPNRVKHGTTGCQDACFLSLERVLIDANDSKITKIVMRRINYLRESLPQLRHIPEKGLRHHVMTSLYKEARSKIPDLELDATIADHLICCMTAIYRDEIRLLLGVTRNK